MSKNRLYQKDESIFTVDLFLPSSGKFRQLARVPVAPRAANHPSYDVAVVELNDEGRLIDGAQLTAVTRRILETRGANANGAVVVLFVHGWHHTATWRDSHFRNFRQILAFLAVREVERYFGRAQDRPGGRRVIGVQVGWNGRPKGKGVRPVIGAVPGIQLTTFRNRYEVAERIGGEKGIRKIVRDLTTVTKGRTRAGGPSQLILMGHSMGGLILESALLTLVRRGGKMLGDRDPDHNDPVLTRIGTQAVLFPDAIISLNSAADSGITEETLGLLSARGVTRSVKWRRNRKVRYSPPLLISATSEADIPTGIWFPAFNKGRKTLGHDKELIQHRLERGRRGRPCDPKPADDFGQNFHCLRDPKPLVSRTPEIPIDLPIRNRDSLTDKGEHRRYRLVPRGSVNKAERLWNFQVPKELIRGHSDIFNPLASSLILALMQISGAVASLARDWDDSFEGP